MISSRTNDWNRSFLGGTWSDVMLLHWSALFGSHKEKHKSLPSPRTIEEVPSFSPNRLGSAIQRFWQRYFENSEACWAEPQLVSTGTHSCRSKLFRLKRGLQSGSGARELIKGSGLDNTDVCIEIEIFPANESCTSAFVATFREILRQSPGRKLFSFPGLAAGKDEDVIQKAFSRFSRREASDHEMNIGGIVCYLEDLITDSLPETQSVEISFPEPVWMSGQSRQLWQVVFSSWLNFKNAFPAGRAFSISGRNIAISRENANPWSDLAPGTYGEVEFRISGWNPGETCGEGVPFLGEAGIMDFGISSLHSFFRKRGGSIFLTWSELGDCALRLMLPDGRRNNGKVEQFPIVKGDGV